MLKKYELYTVYMMIKAVKNEKPVSERILYPFALVLLSINTLRGTQEYKHSQVSCKSLKEH